MEKLVTFMGVLLLGCFVVGTANASYIMEDLTSEYGPRGVDFYNIASKTVEFRMGSGKPVIDFIFADHWGRIEWPEKYGRIHRRWTHKGMPRWYKDYLEFDYGQRRIIRRILFEEKKIDIGDNVTIPKESHCIQDSAVPIGSSALLLGSGVLGLLLVTARRLRFRD